MIDICKINCGADSKNASYNPNMTASRFILLTKVRLIGSCVSIIRSDKKSRKFLKSNEKIAKMLCEQPIDLWEEGNSK